MENSLKKRSDLHLMRKCWHILVGLAAFAIQEGLDWSPKFAGLMAVLAGSVGLILELLRLRLPPLNRIFLKWMKPFLRDSEKNQPTGFVFYAFGCGLSFLFFPWHVSTLAVFFLIFADPFASLFGILYGQKKLWQDKSIVGTVAAFFICFIISYFHLNAYTDVKIEHLLPLLLMAIVGAFAELFTILDDNLSIPLMSSIGILIILELFPIYGELV